MNKKCLKRIIIKILIVKFIVYKFFEINLFKWVIYIVKDYNNCFCKDKFFILNCIYVNFNNELEGFLKNKILLMYMYLRYFY